MKVEFNKNEILIPEDLIVSYQGIGREIKFTGTELKYLSRCLSGVSFDQIIRDMGISPYTAGDIQKNIKEKIL